MKYIVGAGVLGAVVVIAAVALPELRPGASSGRAEPDTFRAAAASLRSGYEISVTRAEAATRVTRSEALATAKNESRFLGGDLEDAHLVYFTDPYYGKVRRGRPPKPFFKHRLSWLVLFRHGTQWVSGPMSTRPPSKPARVGVAAFVDATTGAFLTTMTIADLP